MFLQESVILYLTPSYLTLIFFISSQRTRANTRTENRKHQNRSFSRKQSNEMTMLTMNKSLPVATTWRKTRHQSPWTQSPRNNRRITTRRKKMQSLEKTSIHSKRSNTIYQRGKILTMIQKNLQIYAYLPTRHRIQCNRLQVCRSTPTICLFLLSITLLQPSLDTSGCFCCFSCDSDLGSTYFLDIEPIVLLL